MLAQSRASSNDRGESLMRAACANCRPRGHRILPDNSSFEARAVYELIAAKGWTVRRGVQSTDHAAPRIAT